MFEKLLKRFKKEDKPSKSISEEIPQPRTQEDIEIEEERRNAEIIKKKINELDSQIVQEVEKRIRKEYESEFKADPSNIEECFEELEDIKDGLNLDLIHDRKDPILNALERSIINKVFEEKLIALGSSLDEYYEWLEKEELEDEEVVEDEIQHKR